MWGKLDHVRSPPSSWPSTRKKSKLSNYFRQSGLARRKISEPGSPCGLTATHGRTLKPKWKCGKRGWKIYLGNNFG